MFQPRTLKFFLTILCTFFVLCLPALVSPDYLDSPAGIILLIPYLSIYLFHNIGIPGLLEHKGACGWGWCAPTTFGWIFLCAFWFVIIWLMAWGLSRLTQRAKQSD